MESTRVGGRYGWQISGLIHVGHFLPLSSSRISKSLLISTSGSKALNLANLTLLAGSSSFFTASQTRIADKLHWWVQPSANVTIEDGVALYANRPSDHTGQPCLHVEGRLVWRGKRGGRSSSTLEIMNRNQMEIMEYDLLNPEVAAAAASSSSSSSTLPPFEALLTGGLTSSPHSTLHIHPSARLASACPLNMTSLFGCTIGFVQGEGEMALLLGQHSMSSPINITRLTLENGRNEFFEQVQAQRMEVVEGEMILHGYAFAKDVSVTRDSYGPGIAD